MFSKRILVLLTLLLAILPAVVARGQAPAPPDPPPLPTIRTGNTAVSPADTNLVLDASQDAFIGSAKPSERFGVVSAAVLGLGYRSDNGAQRTLVQFNLNEVPDNAQIVSAELVMYTAVGIPSQDPPMGTELRFLRGPWDEKLVTWGNAPERGDVVANADVLSPTNAQATWVITELVQEWVSGDRENHGVIIIGDENPAALRVRNFYAKDDPSPQGNAFKPRLFITYDEDSEAPTMTMNDLPETVNGAFSVSWSGEDNDGGSGLDFYRIEYRQDFGEWQVWLEETEATSAVFDFAQQGSYYDFRGRATDKAGNESDYSNEVRTLYGVGSPISAMNPLPALTNDPTKPFFDVTWRLVDAGGAEPVRYRLYFRFNDEDWEVWQENMTKTEIRIFPHRGDGLYAYSVQAINNYNIEEPFKDYPEASTLIDFEEPFVEVRGFLPFVAQP